MAAANPTRIGQVNAAGDERALFLKKFSGLLITAFRKRTAFKERHMVRQIDNGKSSQFPATGRVGGGYHTPGTEITGRVVNDAEQTILIDDILVSDVFLPEVDEAVSHFDVRPEYAYQMGEFLANRFDMNVARMGIIAARSSNPVAGLPGGEEIIAGTADTDADVLAGAIFDAVTAMDEKNVPDSDRVCFVKPSTYYMLVESSTKAVHKDYGGEGSYAGGSIIRIAGVPIIKTNNLPTTDQSADTTLKAKYRDDFSTTVASVQHRSSVGTAQLRGLSARMDYDPRRLGTLLVAKYLLGHGVLRSDAAVEIKTSTPLNQVVR